MAVSLNSVVGFNPQLQGRYQHVSSCLAKVSSSKPSHFTFHSYMHCSRRRHLMDRTSIVSCSVSGSEHGASGANGMDDNSISAIDSNKGNSQTPNSFGDSSASKTSEANNSSAPNVQSPAKRTPLTARERLRAARVLSRYTETTKASKPQMGSKLLDVLKESDKKANKKPGLPEAPSNLFDDSKRGMPNPGLTFQLPGGVDILIIAFSFVFISTVMFATTYIVWKVGAIHFNEY